MQIELKDQSCFSCKFLVHNAPAGAGVHVGHIGECRRKAPRVDRKKNEDGFKHFGRWPFVYIDGWCGEWVQHPDAKIDA